MAAENNLGKDKVSRLVWRIAIPSMLGQFVSVLYSIVDRMYIGNIPEIGDVALAGVGVCGPVVTMVGSVAVLVGVGGAPLVSIRMGEEDLSAAKKVLANCFLMLIVFSVLLIGGILPFREPMLRLFGASDATYPFAEEYFTAYLCGTFFALAASGLNQFIICQGFAKIGMASVMLGAALNIVLDPVFIFALDMGVRGAAIATVISQAASAAFVIRFLFGKRVQVPITFGGYDVRVMGRVLVMGFTPFLIVAVDNVMIIAMNAILQRTGGADGDMLVTCNTIVQSFMLVVTMPLGGISGGTQGILGFNYGARQVDRVRQAQKYIVGLCVGYTTLLFVLARVAGPLFVRLFTQDPVLAQEAFEAIKICTLAIIPLGVQYELVDGFTGIGQVRLSLPLSFWRKLVYFVAIFALPAAFGARAAFYAEPLSDILGPAVTIVVYFLAMGKILRERAVTGPDNSRLGGPGPQWGPGPTEPAGETGELRSRLLERREHFRAKGYALSRGMGPASRWSLLLSFKEKPSSRFRHRKITRTQNRKTAQSKGAARAPSRGMGPASRWSLLLSLQGKAELAFPTPQKIADTKP